MLVTLLESKRLGLKDAQQKHTLFATYRTANLLLIEKSDCHHIPVHVRLLEPDRLRDYVQVKSLLAHKIESNEVNQEELSEADQRSCEQAKGKTATMLAT